MDNCSYGCYDDTLELEGYESTPFHIPGIEAWCWEWDVNCHRHFDNLPPLPEAATWIERGLGLAQHLRQIMPDEVSLLFREGDEDLLIGKISYFFLSTDTCYGIGDPNNCTEFLEDDIIQVGDFLPSELPGIQKWYEDFDSRADYADTSADPDFDWFSWNMLGIHYASIIRKHLPDSIQVWYRTPYELHDILTLTDVRFNPDGTIDIADFLKEVHKKD